MWEEMHRTVEYFSYFSKAWRALAEEGAVDSSAADVLGKRAYAWRQSAVFEKLRGKAEELFGGIPASKWGKWDA